MYLRWGKRKLNTNEGLRPINKVWAPMAGSELTVMTDIGWVKSLNMKRQQILLGSLNLQKITPKLNKR